MANDPAFLFYSADFLIGTAFLSDEETGQYIKIMCYMHQNGGKLCPDDMHEKFPEVPKKVLAKFKRDGDGCYYQKRLLDEMTKRKKFTDSRRKNANKRYENPASADASAVHMENTNENINKDVFNVFPKHENFNSKLPEIIIGSVQQLFKITKQHDLTADQVNEFFEIFKVQNLTGKKFYSDVGEVHSHFINWIKTQNISNGTKRNHTNGNGKPSTGADKLAAKLKSNIQTLATGGEGYTSG